MTVAQIIRQHGQANHKYPKDMDITYGDLPSPFSLVLSLWASILYPFIHRL